VADKELLGALVIRAIADDYESVDVATKAVQKWGLERNLVISQAEIIQPVVCRAAIKRDSMLAFSGG